MNRFKADFGHIEDKLNLIKESGRNIGSLSINQQRQITDSLKKMGVETKDIKLAMEEQSGASIQKIVDDQKKKMSEIVRLNEEADPANQIQDVLFLVRPCE